MRLLVVTLAVSLVVTLAVSLMVTLAVSLMVLGATTLLTWRLSSIFAGALSSIFASIFTGPGRTVSVASAFFASVALLCQGRKNEQAAQGKDQQFGIQ